MKESEIQSQIIDYLTILENQGKLFFQRTNNIPVSQMRNGKRVFRKMAKGQKKGFPDIVVIFKRKFVGIEVKTEKGRMSKEQKTMQQLVEKNGGIYKVVRSVDDVKNLLEEMKYWV